MFYNIKIKQQGEKAGAWKGLSIPYYIHAGAWSERGHSHGVFFLSTGEKGFPNGGEIIRREGRKI